MSRSLLVVVAALGVWSSSLRSGFAQDGIPNSSKTDLKLFTDNQAQFKKFLDGQETPTAKDLPLIEAGAKYYVYRLQWSTIKDDPVALAKAMSDIDRELIQPILSPNSSKNTQETRNLFGKYLAKSIEEVLNLDFVGFRPSVIHAALTLPSIARLKSDDFGDMLTNLVADKTRHDAIKLYAFHAIPEYFPARQVTDDDDLTIAQIKYRMTRDLKRIEALTKYIEAKHPTPPNANELDALRYVRREAIKALAKAQVPAVAVLKKQDVEGAVAPTLMRVLLKGGLTPEPSLAEKIEAGLGLCQIKSAELPAYQPETGIYLVCRMLDEFAGAYNKEFQGLKQGKSPPIPWKIQSERLRLGLDELVKNNKSKEADRVARAGKEFLSMIQAHKNLTNPNGLSLVAREVRPTSTVLFKGVKDGPVITLDE